MLSMFLQLWRANNSISNNDDGGRSFWCSIGVQSLTNVYGNPATGHGLVYYKIEGHYARPATLKYGARGLCPRYQKIARLTRIQFQNF